MSIWMRFRPRMRRALLNAAHTAAARGCNAVAAEHLLLAIARDPHSGGAFVLESAGVSPAAVVEELERTAPSGTAQLQRAERLSPAAMHLLDIALAEADRRGEKMVGTQHVALASALAANGTGALLRGMGLVPESADRGLARWTAEQGTALRRNAEGPRRMRFRRWLDQLPRPLRQAMRVPELTWKVVARRSLAHPWFVSRPYRMYRWLRTHAPVRLDPLVPVWVISRYADVALMLKDSRFHKDPFAIERLPAVMRDQLGMGEEEPRQEIEVVSMLFLDPPQHTRVRAAFAKTFTPRMIEGLAGRIQQIADKRLDTVIRSGRMDVVEAIAYPLPVIVIAELLGFPPEDYPLYKKWSDAFAAALGLNPSAEQQAAAEASRGELQAYFNRLVPLRIAHPGDDLLSSLLALERESTTDGAAAPLSRQELFINLMLLLAAGHETTTNLIANGIWSLLTHPDQLRLLQKEPQLIESAVEELLRFESPVQWVSRVVAEPLELGGVALEPGAILLGSLGSANRDPEQFPNPDQLDLRRSPNRHLAFGNGIHFCLGAALARREGQIAISTMLRRLPNLRLAQRRVRWKKGIVFRSMRELAVRFDVPGG